MPRIEEPARPSSARGLEPPARSESPLARPASSSGATYSSYKTPEERAAFIKQQAEQRMAERLAALGLRAPTKTTGETPQQKAEREQKEKEERIRKAEEEDARREQERQRRLNEEQGIPPPAPKATGKKPPPAPPSRKTKADTHDAEAEAAKRAEQDAAERALREEQEAQEAETKAME